MPPTRLRECADVVLPGRFVEVHGDEPTRVVGQERIDASGVLAAQVVGDDSVVDRDERLVRALAALDLGFLTDAPHPFVGASRRVATPSLLCVLPPFWEHVGTTAEQCSEQADLLGPGSWSASTVYDREPELRWCATRCRAGGPKRRQSSQGLLSCIAKSGQLGLRLFYLGGKLILAGHSERIVASAGACGKGTTVVRRRDCGRVAGAPRGIAVNCLGTSRGSPRYTPKMALRTLSFGGQAPDRSALLSQLSAARDFRDSVSEIDNDAVAERFRLSWSPGHARRSGRRPDERVPVLRVRRP